MLFLFSITWGTISGWWVPVCFILGLLYAWLLYRQPLNLANKYRYILASFRFLSVTIIALLLLSPLVKTISYSPQKPLILVLQDNSESIKLFRNKVSAERDLNGFVDQLGNLKKDLGSDFDVREFHFDRNISDDLSKSFGGKQTDISNALQQLNQRFVNQNIGALVLVSDGLYNQGNDPQYVARSFKNSIYTIALGDTIPKRDLLIGNINYNKTAFLGNSFMIEILAEAYQSNGENLKINVTEDGKLVASQSVPVNSHLFRKVLPVKINADKKGLHKFRVSIVPVANELSVQNNEEIIYVDVLDAAKKILLVYDGSHPDISTIKQSIESNRNYEVKTVSLKDLGTVNIADYSLAILYQVAANSSEAVQSILKSKLPLWFINGTQTNLNAYNDEQNLVLMNYGKPEVQEVFAKPIEEFTAFTLTDSSKRKIENFPPLLAPYAQYRSKLPGSTLLRQRIGDITTGYPLLSFGEVDNKRIGVFNAEGFWRWKLAEYQSFGNHHALEELFSQAVQYLTTNSGKQRFSVFPAKNVFDEGENVILNAELYNDALELVNTPDVKIDLKNSDRKNYSFMFNRNAKSYLLDAGSLPVGEYSYSAATAIGTKQFKANGQFTIKALNLESRQSAANFNLLNTIAKQSGGQMLMPSQINQLAALIKKNENIKTVVYEDKKYNEVIEVTWIFVLVLFLLTIEWFFRKREGEI